MTQHWVWVTRPDYYLDEDGNENPELDPDRGYATDDWWTCHKDTREGDLVLLYRSTVKKDIAYLIRATTDAYALEEAQVEEFGPGFQCGFEVLQRLPRPVPIAEMKADPVVATWPALRAAFIKSAWTVPDDVWSRLLEFALVTTEVLESRILAANRVDTLEKTICWELKQKDQLLKAQGLDFKELVIEKAPGPGSGRADLIGFGRTKNPKVVIEVKKGRVGPGAVGQVVRYRDALIDKYRPGRPIEGVLIGESIDRDALVLMRHLPRLRFIPLADFDLDCLRN